MPCVVCNSEKTIKAHLISRSFALEVRSKAGEKHVITDGSGEEYKTSNTGVFDNSILCGNCDGKLGKYEGYVFDFLRKVRATKPKPNSLLECSHIDGDTFVRFAAGIGWKYSVTKPAFGRIEIGPYADVLKQVAFGTSPISSSVDVAGVFLQDGNSDVFFYRAPMPDRQMQANMVRFSVGGFVFFLKIDKRPNPSMPPPQCWLRGKSEGAFLVAPAEAFEEWTKHATAREHPRLRSYFDRMARNSDRT